MPKETITVHLEQVPLEGDATKTEVSVPVASQTTTVALVAESQKISLKGKNVFVDDKPADKDTVVPEGAVVRFTERPRGS